MINLKNEIQRAVEAAHIAALKTGGKLDAGVIDVIAAKIIFQHMIGADFTQCIKFTQVNGVTTGGTVAIRNFKFGYAGSNKKTITRELASCVCKLVGPAYQEVFDA